MRSEYDICPFAPNANCHSSLAIDHALEVFDSRECYKPERARANHIKGNVFAASGEAAQAKSSHALASELFHEIQRAKKKGLSRRQLTGLDYEQLITFWSR